MCVGVLICCVYVCVHICGFVFLEVDGKVFEKSPWPFLFGISLEFISQLDRSWGALARNQVQ